MTLTIIYKSFFHVIYKLPKMAMSVTYIFLIMNNLYERRKSSSKSFWRNNVSWRWRSLVGGLPAYEAEGQWFETLCGHASFCTQKRQPVSGFCNFDFLLRWRLYITYVLYEIDQAWPCNICFIWYGFCSILTGLRLRSARTLALLRKAS
jgi:hypothetical protein